MEEFAYSSQEPVIIVSVSINNKITEFAQLFQNACCCFMIIIKHDKNVFVHTTSFLFLWEIAKENIRWSEWDTEDKTISKLMVCCQEAS